MHTGGFHNDHHPEHHNQNQHEEEWRNIIPMEYDSDDQDQEHVNHEDGDGDHDKDDDGDGHEDDDGDHDDDDGGPSVGRCWLLARVSVAAPHYIHPSCKQSSSSALSSSPLASTSPSSSPSASTSSKSKRSHCCPPGSSVLFPPTRALYAMVCKYRPSSKATF